MIISAVLANLLINVNTQAAQQALQSFQQQVNNLNFHRLETSLQKFGGIIDRVAQTAFGGLVLAAESAFTALERSLSKYQGFIATMRVSTGSVEEASSQYTFLRKVSEDLGIEVSSLTQNYAKLLASIPDVSDKMRIAEEAFLGTAMAARSLHASGEDTRLMFYAITQMASKGILSMEELRRQLAEKLPGAWNLAAKAAGRSTKEFEEEIRKGLVDSIKFLRYFGPELVRTYEESSKVSSKSFDASIARLKSLWMDFTKAVVDSGAATAMSEAVDALTEKLKDPVIIETFTKTVRQLANAFEDFVKGISAEDIKKFIDSFKSGINTLIPVLENLGELVLKILQNLKLLLQVWAAVHAARLGAGAGGIVGGVPGAVVGGVGGAAFGFVAAGEAYDQLGAAQMEAEDRRGKSLRAGGKIRVSDQPFVREGYGATGTWGEPTRAALDWRDEYAKAMGFQVTEEMTDFRKALRKANSQVVLDIIKRSDFTTGKGKAAAATALSDLIYKGIAPKADLAFEGAGGKKGPKAPKYDIGRTEEASRDFLLDVSRAAYGPSKGSRAQYEDFQERLRTLSVEADKLEGQASMYMSELLQKVEAGEVKYATGLMGKVREEIAEFSEDKFSDVLEQINRQYTERLDKVKGLATSEVAANRQVWEELSKLNDELIEVASNYARIQVVSKKTSDTEGFVRGGFQVDTARTQLYVDRTGDVFGGWEKQKKVVLEFTKDLENLRRTWLDLARAAADVGDFAGFQRMMTQVDLLDVEIQNLVHNADEGLNQLRQVTYDGFSTLFTELIVNHKSFSDAMLSMMQRMALKMIDIYIDMLAKMAVAKLSEGAAGGFLGTAGKFLFSLFTQTPAAATGADWTVKGSGGVDSQIVKFRATPGERVLVFTEPQQQQLQSWLHGMGEGGSSLAGGLLTAASKKPDIVGGLSDVTEKLVRSASKKPDTASSLSDVTEKLARSARKVIPAAATGADWEVTGTGGIDSQMVKFRATPGERVMVFTEKQQQQMQSEMNPNTPNKLGGQVTTSNDTYNVSVNVSVMSDGKSETDITGTQENAVQLGRQLEGAVKSVLIAEMRPGGLLSN